MDNAARVQLLVRLVKDQLAPIADRHDAALDLRAYDLEDAHRALFQVATRAEDDPLVVASAGESLAEIWLRRGLFDTAMLNRLAPIARAEARAVIEFRRPQWLDHTLGRGDSSGQ